MEFRQKALARLEMPELDTPVGLTRPRSWLALVALALVVAAGIGWAYAGSVPRTVTGEGVLTRPRGGFRLQSTVAGQVAEVFVSRGDAVEPGTPVAAVTQGGRSRVVAASADGRVSEVVAQPGQVVVVGSTLAVADRTTRADDPLVAVLYLSSGDAVDVRVGGTVELEVESAPAASFGVLRGRVRSVGRVPESARQIGAFLGDDELGARLSAAGPPVRVVVRLATAAGTPSGLAWSGGKGPPFAVASRMSVTGEIRLPAIRPIDWVMPR